MRLMLAGSTFSPIYWRRVQWGLVDLVRQVGFPKFFYTLSPSEWTLPYHGYVLDGMAKLLRGRLRLPVEETLHIVHVLLQTAKGFLLGDTAPRKDWRDHVFAVRDETGQGRRLHGFVRIEFQDGTRKLPTQEYHGSGRPHLHLLVFGDDDLIRTLDLSSAASATMPSDTDRLSAGPQAGQRPRHLCRGEPICGGAARLAAETLAGGSGDGAPWLSARCAGCFGVSPGPSNWGGQNRNAPPVHDQVLGKILRLSVAGVAE